MAEPAEHRFVDLARSYIAGGQIVDKPRHGWPEEADVLGLCLPRQVTPGRMQRFLVPARHHGHAGQTQGASQVRLEGRQGAGIGEAELGRGELFQSRRN